MHAFPGASQGSPVLGKRPGNNQDAPHFPELPGSFGVPKALPKLLPIFDEIVSQSNSHDLFPCVRVTACLQSRLHGLNIFVTPFPKLGDDSSDTHAP